MTAQSVPGLLRPGEVARLLGLDESTVRLADRQGRFKATQRTPGGHRRYSAWATLRLYDDMRRWADKTAIEPALNARTSEIVFAVRLDQAGKGRLGRLQASCTVGECPWVVDIPRSLGTGAEARHFALYLFAGHYLDEHDLATASLGGPTDGTAQEDQARR
jgi:MerR family regulatory protein